MDPISIAGIVESSLGLGLQFGNAAKSLCDIAGKYRNAKLTLKSLAHNLEILQLTWNQIGQWFEARAEDVSLYDDDLIKQVNGFLETGTLVMDALERDLLAYDIKDLNFGQRSKFIWNEMTLQAHQVRIRDQTLSMSLFLQAVQLPTPKARASLLSSSEDQFRKSDESAYSIDSFIPSQLSVSTSQRHSLTNSTLESLEYHPLSFEDKLLMSKVYIRNSKNMMIKKIFKIGSQSKEKGKELIQPVLNWEAIRNELDADSLLCSSPDLSIQDDDTIRRYIYETEVSVLNTPSIPGQESTALLLKACEQGNGALVKDVLSGGVDIHAPFTGIMYSGYKAIHVAALYGHVNVVQILLDSCANIDETDARNWRRPLHFAAGSRQTSMIRFLLGKGAQVDAMTRNAVQPIHEAAWSGSIEALDALIEAGATVNCPDRLGYQPLHWATMTPNQPEVIRYLSTKNADINAKTSHGLRAVQLVSKADAANLGMLLALDAKTDYDDGTTSALITAIDSDCTRSVEMLLKHGVDPNIRASDGSTALHSLARLRAKSLGESLNDKEICRLLLDHGANVNIKDTNGYQVLHCLASYDSALTADADAVEVLAKLVLERGADLDATVSQGWSALYLAIYHGNHQLSKLLIRSGSRILVRKDALCLDLEVIALGSQRTRYTVIVSYNIPGIAGPTRIVSNPPLPVSVDDDGIYLESALKRTLVNLQKHHVF